MGLFKKEDCCLCGGKTGLLDKKCADGKVCKDCCGKLSVYFEDYKDSTKEDLLHQIALKEKDEETLRTLEFNRIFGEFGVILIDDKHRMFTALPATSKKLLENNKQVNSIEDILEFHPDLLSFDCVKDVEIDIKQNTEEIQYTENGKRLSYDPPHYLYSFSFTLRLLLDHPYLKSLYIPLDSYAVQIKHIGLRAWTDPGRRLAAHLLHLPRLIIEDREAIYSNESLLATIFRSEYEMPVMSYGFKCTRENWKEICRYHYYLAMAREIKETIMGKDTKE